MRKFILTTVAALSTLGFVTGAMAEERGHNPHYEHGYQHNYQRYHDGNFRGHEYYHREEFHEGRGHYWHGRWWGPGVGPCWQWTPAGWIWICGYYNGQTDQEDAVYVAFPQYSGGAY